MRLKEIFCGEKVYRRQFFYGEIGGILIILGVAIYIHISLGFGYALYWYILLLLGILLMPLKFAEGRVFFSAVRKISGSKKPIPYQNSITRRRGYLFFFILMSLMFLIPSLFIQSANPTDPQEIAFRPVLIFLGACFLITAILIKFNVIKYKN